MTIADIRKTATEKMGKSVEAFKHELQKIRSVTLATWLMGTSEP